MKGSHLQSLSVISLAVAIGYGSMPPRTSPVAALQEVRGPWSVQDGGGTVQRRAWVDLLAEDLPMRGKDLVAFYHRERESFDGDLAPSLFYLDVWDVIGRFGMPSSMYREASDVGGAFDWELTYAGLDFITKDEFGDAMLVKGLTFQFFADSLVSVDVLIEDD